MIRACLFDIGNVLVSFDYRRTFPALAAKTSRSYDDIHRHLSEVSADLESGRLSSAAFVRRAVDYLGPEIGDDEFLAAFTGIFEPVHPVWDMVAAIRRKVPVYLFSNTSEIHETSLFRQYPDFSDFDGGFYSWRIGSMKPDNGIYEHALSTLGLPGESIAYIDDLPANIETGRRHGFHCHLFDRHAPDALADFLAACGLPAATAR